MKVAFNRMAHWDGLDAATVSFARRMHNAGRLTGSEYGRTRDWLRTLEEAGLPTDLDLDFDEPDVSTHLERQVQLSGSCASETPRPRHLRELRRGLKIYELAFAEGVRTRPVPPIALRQTRRFAISHELIRNRLPAADQAALAQIETIVNTLARLQWEGKGGKAFRTSDGRNHHTTIAITTAWADLDAVRSFLQHCHRKDWMPFTLDALLTPERVCDFLFYGESFNGSFRTAGSLRSLAFGLRDFFYRGRLHHPDPVVVISEEREKAIDAQIAVEKTRTHLHQVRPARESNSGESKWFPSLSQVEWAVTALKDDIARAESRHARGGMSDRDHWRAVRDATLALVTLFSMARCDSASTISLSHLARDGDGRILTQGGSAIVRGIVRAKTHNRLHYPFVPEFILPGNVLPLINRLLAIEGRSLEAPLRSGERPVRLSAADGDKWGRSPLPSGAFDVVPLWRLRPDHPRGLAYAAIRQILERKLVELRFGSTNPHTFRATGAIYWSFVRGMPQEHVMAIGLWNSPEELRASYAKITSADRMRLMSTYIPLEGTDLPAANGERERAAAEAIGVLTDMLSQPRDASGVERLLARLKALLEGIERTVASERGVHWEPAVLDRFRSGEVERLDDALRGAGYGAGIKSVLGRDFFAADALLNAAKQAALSVTPPPRIQRLNTTLATRKPIEARTLRRAT